MFFENIYFFSSYYTVVHICTKFLNDPSDKNFGQSSINKQKQPHWIEWECPSPRAELNELELPKK